jgi:hypothetical protein
LLQLFPWRDTQGGELKECFPEHVPQAWHQCNHCASSSCHPDVYPPR